VQSMRMCEAFAARGLDVTAVTRAGDTTSVFDHYGVARTFAHVPVPAARMRGVRTAAFELEVLRLARMVRPDVVFTRDIYAAALLSTSWPTTLELHRTMDGHRAELLALQALVRLRRLRRVVVVSHGMADWYRRHVPGIAPVVVPGAAQDPGPPPSSSLSSSSSARLRLGYVGRLYAGRGAELLMAIAARRSDVELHLVGATAAEYAGPVPDNVTFHGHVPHHEVAARLHSFDVLLAPYQRKVFVDGGAETGAVMSPLKLFEYLAAGRAVVTSYLPVLREVLDDSVAMLCTPDDVDSWLQAVDRLRDSGTRERLAATGRARFLARHTWAARVEQVLA
jgi:glycosyltransferase involved in cell wall biosynthesis